MIRFRGVCVGKLLGRVVEHAGVVSQMRFWEVHRRTLTTVPPVTRAPTTGGAKRARKTRASKQAAKPSATGSVDVHSESTILPPQNPALVGSFLDKIVSGLDDMIAANEGFAVKRLSDTELKIDAGGGHIFSIELTPTHGLQLLSPVHPRGGSFAYVYDEKFETFISPKDGHSLVECLARDLVYLCKGIPHF